MRSYIVVRALLPAALVAIATISCSKSEESKVSTQVAAKVNAEEISVHQVNDMLTRTGNLPPDQVKAAGTQILDRLIDQELLVQQAHEKKLDRDAGVMKAIESAKREILARAYLEQVAAAAAAKVTELDVKDFYDKHPELFKERRVYNLHEIAIGATPEFMPKLQEQMNKGMSLNDLLKWLKGQDVKFTTNAGVKAAEQLPLEVLPQFHKLKDGQTAVIPNPNAILVVQVASSQVQPLDLKQATPFIEQYLNNQKRGDLAAREVKKLRGSAKIAYMGEFSKPDAAAKGAGSSTAGRPAAAPALAVPQGTTAKEMEKGVAGLK